MNPHKPRHHKLIAEFLICESPLSLGGAFCIYSELFAYEGVPPVRILLALEI
jgi:hypothetical protein